jgi:hypothetical protein
VNRSDIRGCLIFGLSAGADWQIRFFACLMLID